jgi:hypothetical protein
VASRYQGSSCRVWSCRLPLCGPHCKFKNASPALILKPFLELARSPFESDVPAKTQAWDPLCFRRPAACAVSNPGFRYSKAASQFLGIDQHSVRETGVRGHCDRINVNNSRHFNHLQTYSGRPNRRSPTHLRQSLNRTPLCELCCRLKMCNSIGLKLKFLSTSSSSSTAIFS